MLKNRKNAIPQPHLWGFGFRTRPMIYHRPGESNTGIFICALAAAGIAEPTIIIKSIPHGPNQPRDKIPRLEILNPINGVIILWTIHVPAMYRWAGFYRL